LRASLYRLKNPLVPALVRVLLRVPLCSPASGITAATKTGVCGPCHWQEFNPARKCWAVAVFS